jgi:hypothetical protein
MHKNLFANSEGVRDLAAAISQRFQRFDSLRVLSPRVAATLGWN